MALTLTANLAAPTDLAPAIRVTVTGTVPADIDAGYRFRLGDEILELSHFGETEQAIAGGAGSQVVDDRNVWYAKRGVDGTAAVAHLAGVAVEAVTDALVVGEDEVVPDRFATGGGASPVVYATATLTNAQIIALPTTPVEIVAAPAAGTARIPLWMTLATNSFSVADYENIGENCQLVDGAGHFAEIRETGESGVSELLSGSDPAIVVMTPKTVLNTTDSDYPLAKPNNSGDGAITLLVLNLDGSFADAGVFTGGNAANVLKVVVAYIDVVL